MTDESMHKHTKCILECNLKTPWSNYIPELSMGLPIGTGSGSFISTTTQSDIKKVLATEDACSKQHLTTCTKKYDA